MAINCYTIGTSTAPNTFTMSGYDCCLNDVSITTGTNVPVTTSISFTTSKGVISIEQIMEKLQDKPDTRNIFDFFTIDKIEVYNDKVVKVTFIDNTFNSTIEVKAICDEDDVFDLEKGVYVCIAKLLYKGILTAPGIESASYDIALFKNNVKNVNKAIKKYYKELKEEEKNKEEEKKEKAAKLHRRNKNRIRKQKRKEKTQQELMKLIKQATKEN